MFIAMNRFKIVLGKEIEFEKVWRERDTHLNGAKGFKEFHLVKGEKNNDFHFMLLTQYGILEMILLIGQNQKLLDWLIKCR